MQVTKLTLNVCLRVSIFSQLLIITQRVNEITHTTQGSIFQKFYYTVILAPYPLHGCVDEVVYSQANYQGCRYHVHFRQCYTFAVIRSVNGERVC